MFLWAISKVSHPSNIGNSENNFLHLESKALELWKENIGRSRAGVRKSKRKVEWCLSALCWSNFGTSRRQSTSASMPEPQSRLSSLGTACSTNLWWEETALSAPVSFLLHSLHWLFRFSPLATHSLGDPPSPPGSGKKHWGHQLWILNFLLWSTKICLQPWCLLSSC